MDDPQRAIYRLSFRVAFLEKKGQVFEDWFCRLAAFALGPDFERVMPYGPDGDRKADGRSLGDRTIYQCHAPERLDKARLCAKIERDFRGALEHWGHWMRRWVFVHNGVKGLPAEVLRRLDTLRAEVPSITIESWSEAELTPFFDRLDRAGLEAVFGVVPGAGEGDLVARSDVEDLIGRLARAEPDPDAAAAPSPSAEKIHRNALSADVRAFLAVGERKGVLVRDTFEDPAFHVREHIAEALRGRYRRMKSEHRSPDDIFSGLLTGIGAGGSVRRQVAALAVLAYFFDRCDIFENPEGPA